jgi:putative transposase
MPPWRGRGRPKLLNQLGRIVAECWRAIPVHFGVIELDEFIVMPNHIHGIVCSTGEGHAPPLHLVIESFKSATSRLAGRRLWQRSYYDRVIRNETELHELRKYIGENPLRWRFDLRVNSTARSAG